MPNPEDDVLRKKAKKIIDLVEDYLRTLREQIPCTNKANGKDCLSWHGMIPCERCIKIMEVERTLKL